jgi:hypothetical protein
MTTGEDKAASVLITIYASKRSNSQENNDNNQGCRIFLGTSYHNGKKIPNDQKIYQMTRKYTR